MKAGLKKLSVVASVLMITFCSHVTYAQVWDLTINISGNAPGCTGQLGGSMTATFMGQNYDDGSASSVTITKVLTQNTVTNQVLAISAGWNCCPLPGDFFPCFTDGPDGYMPSINISGDCAAVYLDGSSSPNFNFSIAVFLTRRAIPQPTVTVAASCSSPNIDLQVPPTSSNSFQWQVSEDGSTWRDFGGNTNAVSVTADALFLSGFVSKYSPRHIRVIDPVCWRASDIRTIQFYAPQPTANFSNFTEPTCNGYADGEYRIVVTAGSPDVNAFVVSAYTSNPAVGTPLPFNQGAPQSGNIRTVSGLAAGTFWFRIQNNTDVTNRGSCFKDYQVTLGQPTAVSVTFTAYQYPSGTNLKCAADTTGKVTANATGGSGSYTTYQWTGSPPITSGNRAFGLNANTLYGVTVTDTKGCTGSGSLTSTLTAPAEPLAASINSTGGSGGYGVTCADAAHMDGKLSVSTTGGSSVAFYKWTGRSETTSTLVNLGVGNYEVTVTDINGCTASSNITLSAPIPITFDLIKFQQITCPGQPTGILKVQNIQHVIGTYTIQWNGSNGTPTHSNLSAGSYTAKITDAQGCSQSMTTSLDNPPGYSVTITADAVHNGAVISCNGEDDGTLNAVVKDASNQPASATSYAWTRNGSPFGSTPSVAGASAGSYNVSIIYGSGCQAQASYTLNDPSPVSAVVTVTSTIIHNGEQISCPGASDGALHVAASGGTPGTSPMYTFLWSDTSTGADITGKPAGTYTVTVKDANACVGTGSFTLVDPAPINPSVSLAITYNGLHITCHNAADGKLIANTTGGAGTLSYLWSRGDNGQTLNNVAPGNYFVTVSDANGCSQQSSPFTVINPTAVSVNATVTSNYFGKQITCPGAANGSLRATASGGTNSFTYLWNGTTAGADLTGKPAGSYTVVAADQNGCTASATEVLVDPDPVTAVIGNFSDFNGYGVTCNGKNDGFAEVTPGGGTQVYTYLWSNAETAARTNNLTAGSYSVTVTDQNGCTTAATHTITQPLSITAIVTQTNILCNGSSNGSLSINGAGGGVSPYSYSIDNTGWTSLNNFIGLPAGAYTVRVRDQNSCVYAITRTLTQPSALDISFTTQPAFCADPRGEAYAVASGGVGSYTYAWRDANGNSLGTASSITGRAAGVYTLQIRDANNCPWEENIGIVTTDGPQVEATNLITNTCSYSADGSGTVNVTDGDAPFTYIWPDGQTSSTGVNLPGGSYLVTVTDVNNCATVAEVVIPAPDPLTISTTKFVSPNCKGECNGEIDVTSTGGNGGYDFSWTGQSGSHAVGLCAGDHAVTVTDDKGCTFSRTFVLAEPDVLEVKLVSRILPLCNGSCDGRLEVTASGGNGGYQYSWSAGSQLAVAQTLCAGDHTVTVKDLKNCSVQATYGLGEPTPVQLILLRNQAPVCHDGCNGVVEVAAIGGTGSYTYRWNTGSTSELLENLCSDTYLVELSDAHACKTTASYAVGNPPALVVDVGESVTLCVGQTHTLDAGSTWSTYAWRSNTGFTANTQKVTVSQPGAYWLEVFNVQGCLARDTFMLATSVDLLRANMIITSEAVVGDTIVMVDVSWPLPDNIAWEYPTAMELIGNFGDVLYGKFNKEGLYQVKLSAALGECRDEMSKTISILRGDQNPSGGKLGYESFVLEFDIYPNPTDGSFNVNVELKEESSVTLSVWSAVTGKMISRMTRSDRKHYVEFIDLRPLTSGPYVLRLDHPQGYQTLRFIVY